MIRIQGLEFRFGCDPHDFALSISDWAVAAEEKVAIIGPSGSGKTTLLHLIAGILLPEHGRIHVDGTFVNKQSSARRQAFRITRFGMVFQTFQLLDYLNVLENILLPYRINPALRLTAGVRARARALADELGLAHLLRRRIDRVSQGERQRVAFCRALLPQPKILLADEPTGNLDPRSTARLKTLLFEHTKRAGATLVAVTHDPSMVDRFDRVVEMTELSAGA